VGTEANERLSHSDAFVSLFRLLRLKLFARTYTVSCFWRKRDDLLEESFSVRRLRAATPKQAVAATIVEECLRWIEGGIIYHFDPTSLRVLCSMFKEDHGSRPLRSPRTERSGS
jgi:hypothetical protein